MLGRINELLSSIRMKYEGDMVPITVQSGSLDSTAISDIHKHLKVIEWGYIPSDANL